LDRNVGEGIWRSLDVSAELKMPAVAIVLARERS
jgi:hypothetical protein